MTIERASELVSKLRVNQVLPEDLAAIHLFNHFVQYFDLQEEQIGSFAILCGYKTYTIHNILDRPQN